MCSPVKYELDFHIPEDGILHSHRRENLKSYKTNIVCCNYARWAFENANSFLICYISVRR
jgi:hypothetical protein